LDGRLRRLRRFGRKLADTHWYLDSDSDTNPVAVADTSADTIPNAHSITNAYADPDADIGADGRMPEGRQVVGGGVERRR